jgi:hypothetical protein
MFEQFPKSPLEWTQLLVNRLVAVSTYKLTLDAIDDHTDLERSGIPAQLTSVMAGEVAASVSAPVTNSAVVKTWDWVSVQKIKRDLKKQKKADKEK